MIYIILAIAANFVYDNPTSFALGILSYPVLIWILVHGRKKLKDRQRNAENNAREKHR